MSPKTIDPYKTRDYVTQRKNINYFFYCSYGNKMSKKLFPLDGAGGFGADIVDHAVDSVDLVDDAVGELSEQFVRQVRPVCGHTIGAGNRANGNHVFVSA